MSDRERVLDALRAAGPYGVTTLYIRSTGLSGNPSQRRAELEELGHVIRAEPEKIGERWYKRYFLDVDVEVGGVSGDIRKPDRGAADLSVERVCRHCRVPQRVGRPACACEEDGPVWVEAESLKLFESAA